MSDFMSKAASRRLLAGLACAMSFTASALHAQTAAVPDFSGMWGRNAFNFEPLPNGPKPIDNLKRLPNGIGDPNALVGDYNNPILKPEAAKIVKERGEMSLKGEIFPDPSNHCAPYAPPFNFSMQLGMQMLQTKDHITFLYNQDDQVRRVRLNGTHPAKVTPTPMGDSVGHYEGDVLVVDTVGVATGPLAMMDRYGTPRSAKFHLVERYRLIDYDAAKQTAERHIKEDGPAGLNGNVQVDQDYKGKGLQVQFTIEDPEIFTAPLSATATYRRIKGAWQEQICAENTTEYYSGKQTAIPTSAKPDF